MVGRSLNRPPNLIQLLSLAAFVHVLIWPEEVHEIGFQLSYSAVLGIALLFVPGRKWLVYKTNRFLKFNTKSKRVRAIKWIVIHAQEVLLISLAAQVYTAPLAIFYFQQFPIYFLLANLLVYPLSFIALFAGFLLLIVGDLPFVGFMLGWVVEKSLISISELAGVVSGFPNAIVQLNFVDIRVAVAVWLAFLLYGIHVSQRANRFSL